MRYLTNSLLILILLLSVVLTGCYKYKFMETIYIDDIYTQEEDEYLIYFYTEDCYYCKKSYDTIQEYLNYQEENDSIVVKINYDVYITGNIIVFDPYESIYDQDDEEYIYPIYKTTNELTLNGLEVYIELFKNKNDNYKKYKIIDKAIIDITDYLSEMNLHYKE